MVRNSVHVTLLVAVAVLSGCARRAESHTDLRARAREALAQTAGTLRVAGLAQPVEVLRDAWGIPHIYAKTADDLFVAQGFVVAQDRLYQMEIWRRTGAGELAEVFGPDYLERDRFARLVRYRGEMKPEWESYSPDTRAICAAFARGVNAYIRQAGQRLPIEFQILDFRPGEWKAEDCLLRIAGLLMTRNLTQEIARAELVAQLGAEAALKYMPTDPPRALDPDPEVDYEGLDGRVLGTYRRAIAVPTLHQEGSNNWVVDGTLSVAGKPILASDPHRPVILPSLRYLVHLVGPGWNVIGSGEPALPGVAIGHNERIGFGFTIAGYDQCDLYVERTDPRNPNRYVSKGEWREMRVDRERIRVKGRAGPVEVELRYTVHGPVIYEDRAKNRVVALRWAGDEPGTAGYLGSLALGRARNWQEFLAALERWKLPTENMVYADVDGNIGWLAAGLLPVRKSWSGLLPVAGHTGRHEWSGFRAVRELPQTFNPPSHYIATANHNIRPKNYPYDLNFDWAPPYRFRRIDEVLQQGKKFSVRDFERLQHEETSLVARELVSMLKPVAAAPEPKAMLVEWDEVLSKDSAAAALYELWVRELPARYLELEVPRNRQPLVARHLSLPTVIGVLAAMPEERRARLFADALEAAVAQGVRLLGSNLRAWRWGRLHTITFRHPLANDPERRALFDLGPVERGGDAYTVMATGGGGFSQASGASYRHILDLADWDRSVFTSTPGQSGQPGSPHYGDLLPHWAEGRYQPLAFSRAAVEKHAKQKLVLQPE